MRFKELVVGERYVLNGYRNAPAIFEGKHEGKLELADGATYIDNSGFLRFRVTVDGVDRVVLLNNGTDVMESESAKQKREKAENERKIRESNAFVEAKQFLESLGFDVAEGYSYEARGKDNTVTIRSGAETADEIEVDAMSVGKLRRLLTKAQGVMVGVGELGEKKS